MQLLDDDLFGTAVISSTPEGSNVLKASFFTLIVVAKGIENAQRCQKFVSVISKKFPCKIIFIAIDSDARESFLKQNLSVRTVGNKSSAISCDVLVIEASQDQAPKIPFLVIPEILADLPAFLLVGHDPSIVKDLIDKLESHVDRIVFDIPRLKNIGLFAEQILSLPKKHKYIDLSWARIKPWRESLSRTFNSKEALDLLKSCNRLEIRYSHLPTPNHYPDTQALLLQVWLGSRLGWQLTSIDENADHYTLHYTHGTREVIIILSPTDSSIIEDGNIVSVEVIGDNEVHFLLAHERDDRHIVIHSSFQDRCEMPYSLFVGSFQKGRSLPSEIFLQAASEHYLPSLESLSSKL